MRLSTTDILALIVFAGVCVVCIVVLASLHDLTNTVQQLLGDLAFGSLGAAAGVARSGTRNTP